MQTLQQVKRALKQGGKPVSTAQLYRYFRRFNIKPLAKTRPVFYPDATAAKILSGLGLTSKPEGGAK